MRGGREHEGSKTMQWKTMTLGAPLLAAALAAMSLAATGDEPEISSP